MWAARNKSGMLFIFNEKPRKDEKHNMWFPTTKEWGKSVDASLFPMLTWEDEPTEIRLVENNPLLKRICPHCGKTVSYHHSDVKTAYDGQPCSGLPDLGEDYIICTECDKMIYL